MAARTPFDLADVDLSRETGALFPLRGGEPALAQQRRFGTWWTMPFARTTDGDLVGFRLIPGTRIVDCPIVWTSGPAAVTVASRSDRVVPAIIFTQMLSAPRRWVDASELLDSEWEELCAAHRALGGVDELAELRKVASDHALRE